MKKIKLSHLLNESNGAFNKKVSNLLDSKLDSIKKGSPDFQWCVKEVLKGALTDANFHDESKQVDRLFPKAKLGSYTWTSKLTGDETSFAGKETELEKSCDEIGRKISNMAKWDGHIIIDAFAYYVSMTIGRPVGEKIQSLYN